MKTEPDMEIAEGRRERKQRLLRQKLTSTAMEMFSTQGYDAVTMEQIATKADVAKGTLYNHFPIKEALIASWLHEEIESNRDRLLSEIETQKSFNSQTGVLFAASINWCETNKAYLPAYLRYRLLDLASPEPGRKMHTLDGLGWIFADLIKYAQDRSELRNDLTAQYLAEILAHMYLGVLMRWLSGGTTDLEAELETMLTLFRHGSNRRD